MQEAFDGDKQNQNRKQQQIHIHHNSRSSLWTPAEVFCNPSLNKH